MSTSAGPTRAVRGRVGATAWLLLRGTRERADRPARSIAGVPGPRWRARSRFGAGAGATGSGHDGFFVKAAADLSLRSRGATPRVVRARLGPCERLLRAAGCTIRNVDGRCSGMQRPSDGAPFMDAHRAPSVVTPGRVAVR